VINLIGTQLVSLPQGLKSAVSTQLPWPNGSIVSARMVPGESAGHVILMLGGYRFQAKVPANTPMGNIWMQVVNREMPAQFRLLSDFKAASMLAEMLSNKVKPQEQAETGKPQPKTGQDTVWQKMESNQFPFQVDTDADAHRIMLRDRNEDAERGVVNASSDEEGFLLHGRADLDYLGPVAFALEGSENEPWTLKLYAGREANLSELRSAFMKWLQEQADSEDGVLNSQIEGKVMSGLPQQFESIEDIRA